MAKSTVHPIDAANELFVHGMAWNTDRWNW